MNIFHKIKMPLTHRLSLLYIILISGFKLGMAAPTDSKKGKTWTKRWNVEDLTWLFLITFVTSPFEMDLTVVRIFMAEKKSINEIEFLS